MGMINLLMFTASETIQELNSSLLQNSESTYLLLLGDFNLPDPPAPIKNGSQADHNIFGELKGHNFLHQFIPGSNHTAGNKLDLLLSKLARGH